MANAKTVLLQCCAKSSISWILHSPHYSQAALFIGCCIVFRVLHCL